MSEWTMMEGRAISVLRGARTRNDLPGLFEVLGVRTLIEVGVRAGQNLRKMIAPSCIERAYAVDIWSADAAPSENDAGATQEVLDRQYRSMVELAARDPRVVVLREHSEHAASRFAPGSIDLVYIDADHTYDAVRRDIAAYAPLVRHGGILGGHDYVNTGGRIPFGVKRAVDEYAIRRRFMHRLHITTDNPRSWYIVMPKQGGAP